MRAQLSGSVFGLLGAHSTLRTSRPSSHIRLFTPTHTPAEQAVLDSPPLVGNKQAVCRFPSGTRTTGSGLQKSLQSWKLHEAEAVARSVPSVAQKVIAT
ncbi:hypothetical protein E2C01_016778 [Portunus trituberculatus]|uniref:Uncharacterized protein n=1 Tax=Portunus trituberculatus TaxID=210409 RepID=A0A5B7DQQ0_PORTR|nr:hypothetical protein [Portunus trituberculatus]